MAAARSLPADCSETPTPPARDRTARAHSPGPPQPWGPSCSRTAASLRARQPARGSRPGQLRVLPPRQHGDRDVQHGITPRAPAACRPPVARRSGESVHHRLRSDAPWDRRARACPTSTARALSRASDAKNARRSSSATEVSGARVGGLLVSAAAALRTRLGGDRSTGTSAPRGSRPAGQRCGIVPLGHRDGHRNARRECLVLHGHRRRPSHPQPRAPCVPRAVGSGPSSPRTSDSPASKRQIA